MFARQIQSRMLPPVLRARRVMAMGLLLTGICSHAIELSEQELRGKQIYLQGESRSGAPITVLVSRGGTPIAASLLPCSGCHGEDGKGRPEGGVKPSDITWKTLTASYGHDHEYGRSHPAFDEMSLARAVILGRDPADNELDTAMPRYTMSEPDMKDLVAYIKKIETDLDPGLEEDVIRLGTLLPLEGPLQGLGHAMKSVLDGYFKDINDGGGIHGRRIVLVVGEYVPDAMRGEWNARDFLQKETIFAMVSGYVTGIEPEIAALAEEKEMPLVGPHTVSPDDGDGLYSYSFYLLGGISHQAQVLSRYANAELQAKQKRLAIVRPNGAVYEAAARSAQVESAADADSILTISYQPPYFDAVDTARKLRQESVGTVLFLGTANDLRRLADEAGRNDWTPDLMLPGVFASKGMFDIPAGYEGRVLLAYSSMPSDHTEKGVREFEQLHAEHGLDYRHSTAQISAFVAAKVLVEGLKRAGRDLSRARLVSELEGLSDFQPGLMPPISYNATRRIGALGGYVVALDLQQKGFGGASKWIELQP